VATIGFIFHELSMTDDLFHDFSGLENMILKCQDFPRYVR